MLAVVCSVELEAQRDRRERDVWEREMRDIREMEFMEKMKHDMELKLPGLSVSCDYWCATARGCEAYLDGRS